MNSLIKIIESILCIIIVIICSAFNIKAQQLSHSRITSYYTYLYKVNNEDVKKLCLEKKNTHVLDYLRTLVDSFPTDSGYKSILPNGNYLHVLAVRNELKCDLKLIHDFQVRLIPSKTELAVGVYRKDGSSIDNATVELAGRIIKYDPIKKWYSLPKSNKKGRLFVEVNDNIKVYDVSRAHNNAWILRTIKIISYSFPVKYILYPFRKIYYALKYHRRRNYYNPPGNHKGYMAFNKPLYLPNDTLMLKTFLVNRKGRSLKKSVRLEIYKGGYYRDNDNKAIYSTTLNPVSKGAYVFDFPLSDTLKLDQYYEVRITNLSNSKTTLINGSFRYEDYQLDETKYKIKMDKEKFIGNEPIEFSAKGNDANGLPLLDGRIQIVIEKTFINDLYLDSAYIPDTLWQHEQMLDPSGETRIVIPDSLISVANISYVAKVLFNNSNNESHDTTLRFTIDKKPEALVLELEDSLIYAHCRPCSNKAAKEYFLIGTTYEDDTLVKKKVSLPFKNGLNPLASQYTLITKDNSAALDVDSEDAEIRGSATRTKDSVIFQLNNPRNIDIQYTILRETKEIKSGINKKIFFVFKDSTKASYFFICHYLWGGESREYRISAHLFEKDLSIQINQPGIVYPGEKTEVTVKVTDYTGKPIDNVNLTASSINSQFKNTNAPDVPYLGKGKYGFPYRNSFEIQEVHNSFDAALNDSWIKSMRLDTIAYYKAIYPKESITLFYDSVKSELAQFAPYIFSSGLSVPIYMIYIDDRFVYYSGDSETHTYSFAAKPGYHKISLRTRDKMIDIDSVYFQKGHKLELILKKDGQGKNIKTTPLKEWLSAKEKNLLSSTMFFLEDNLGYKNIYAWQANNIHMVRGQNSNYYSGGRKLMIGPFNSWDPLNVAVQDKVNLNFRFEGGYDCSIEGSVIKMKKNNRYAKRKIKLSYFYPHYEFGGVAYEEKDIMLNSPKYVPEPFITNAPYQTQKSNGTYRFYYKGDSSLYAIGMMQQTYDSLNHWMFKGNKRIFYDLAPGKYHFIFITNNGYYFEKTIHIRPNSTFCEIIKNVRFQKVSSNKAVKKIMNNTATSSVINENTNYSFGSGCLKISIKDKQNGEGVSFANVSLEKNNMQVMKGVADIDGNATLKPLASGYFSLKVAAVGYSFEEVRDVIISLNKTTYLTIDMDGSNVGLNEVMLIEYSMPLIYADTKSGYTITRESFEAMPSKCINSIASTTAGVFQMDEGTTLNIRGGRANGTAYYIDGVQVQGSAGLLQLGGLPASYSDSLTGKDMNAKSMRDHYSDYAYWQPNLITDKNGEAKFNVVFPDNITQWKSYVIGMDDKKHSGIGYATTKAFKKLSAQLSVPRFLIIGDKCNVIGKTFNYTGSTYKLQTKFSVNAQTVTATDTVINNSLIQSQEVSAIKEDSVTVTYSLKLSNGYMDGEKEKIPVFPQGVLETTGKFYVLENDTAININLDAENAATILYMSANPIDILLKDIETLKQYPYDCNEQKASKLKAYLMEKRIKEQLGEKFNGDFQIRKLIKRLEDAQRDDGSWGWWKDSPSNPWMTMYVIRTFSEAAQQESKIRSVESGLEYIKSNMDNLGKNDLLNTLNLLSEMKESFNYEEYLKRIKPDSLNMYQYLIIQKIRQANGLSYNVDSILKKKKDTYMGNYYWGENPYSWYDNKVQLSLLAYQILKKDSIGKKYLHKISNFFLEERNNHGEWINTVTSACILDAILPDVLSENGNNKVPASVIIDDGSQKQTVDKFPYTAKISSSSLTLKKKGATPVYATTYQKKWNSNPSKADKDFIINSYFVADGERTDKLKAGVPAALTVDVEVKKLGEYIMIEIPIPAGCSYGDNKNNVSYLESHREYFKNKTSIFCERLNPGKYQFKIELEPRFTGYYTLNPAQTELMYFPTFSGRNEIKQVEITK